MHLCRRMLGGLPQACGSGSGDPAKQDFGVARLVQGATDARREGMSPRPYIRKVPRSWWLRHRRYFAYMVRELTSLSLAVYSTLLVMGLLALAQGRGAWESFLGMLSS